MKKLIILCLFVALAATSYSQSFKGFFRPVDSDMFKTEVNALNAIDNPSEWKFRPTVEVTAFQLTYNRDTKKFDSSSLQSAGPGISYSHFIEVNGEPYNNFGVNGLLLFGIKPGETVETSISGAVTVSALEFINVGAGYNFTVKTMFLLTGVTIKF